MSSTSSRWRPLLILLMFAAATALAGAFADRLGFRPLDWQNYMAAAGEVVAGRSAYGEVEFFAPPWVALMLVPLTWLPPSFAAGLWLLVSLAAVLALAVLWIEYADYPRGHRVRLLAGIAPVLSPAALYVYITGQITALAGLALICLIYLNRRPGARPWLMAIAALAASAKPHIVGFPLLLLLLYELRHRRWRLSATVAASLTAAALVSLLVLPDWPGEWLRALSGGDYLGGNGLVAEGYLGYRELGIPGVVLALPMLYAAYVWYRRGPKPTAVALALASALAWVPYVRIYDQIVLWPAVLTAAAAWHGTRLRWAFALPLLAYFVLPLTDLALLLPVVLLALLLARTSIRGADEPAPA